MPERCIPGMTEAIPQLCQVVISTAERARHAAWDAAGVEPLSACLSVTSWHRIAAASTVTSHHCHVLWTTLADRVANDPTEAHSARLQHAAALASAGREQWLDAAREFEDITTDVRGYISPAAAEAAELALWTGRLTYADPGWTLASGPSQTPRAAASLAPRLKDMPNVVEAVHQTSEALSSLATANLEQARTAVRARRLLVSTRLLSERHNVPRRFTRAPTSYTTSLLACCQDNRNAASEAAAVAGDVAMRVEARSSTLATARKVVQEERLSQLPHGEAAPSRTRASQLEPAAGPVEASLRERGVTSSRLLWRAAAIDQATQQVMRDATADQAQRGRRQLDLGRTPTGAATVRTALARSNRTPVASAVRDEPEAEA
jgi:hypothetical protein